MTTGVSVTHTQGDYSASNIEATAPSAGHEIAISPGRTDVPVPADAGTDDYGTALHVDIGDWENQFSVYEQADLSDDPTHTRATGEAAVVRVSYDDASGTAASSAIDGDLGGSTSTPSLPAVANASINDSDFLAIIGLVGQQGDARTATTWPSGFTEDIDTDVGSEGWWAGTVHIATKLVTGHTTSTDYSPGSVTMSGTSLWTGFTVIVPTSSAAATLDLEGFRWRNDDGSETAATWAETQDTNTTEATGTTLRLRTLIDATGDPAAAQYKLQYRRDGSAETWRDV